MLLALYSTDGFVDDGLDILFAGYGGLEWGNNLNSVSFGLMFVCSDTEFLLVCM